MTWSDTANAFRLPFCLGLGLPWADLLSDLLRFERREVDLLDIVFVLVAGVIVSILWEVDWMSPHHWLLSVEPEI